ncbi:hypothetical protein EDD37DRAFT_642575 [Exophiala viscosa]|uniref:G-patch domain-containing protein n=1 Tax=Exophiala viscosa TaxID=2486360 RepID=A0AAN6ICH9_9EURO|nr:hypothetical protein EDD36DRAFT_407060 [Exophiala viscosa]KAI1619925.1 hypothetical protein EDD37DRAFT_642575 [Exophiala viscosa]
MGARERARARGKKGNGAQKSPKWSQRQSSASLKVPDLDPRLRHRALLQDWQDFSDSGSPHGRNGMFSMSQEARNTERHASGWGTTRLRDQTVAFVSAGSLVRDELDDEEKQDDTEQERGDLPSEDPRPEQLKARVDDHVEEQPQHTDEQDGNTEAASAQTPSPAPAPAPTAALPPKDTQPRRVSVSSDSSGEEILFAGRQNAGQSRARTIKGPPRNLSPPAQEPLDDSADFQTTEQSDAAPQNDVTSPSRKFKPISLRSKKMDRRGKLRLRSTNKRDEEEAIMNDYIANLAMNDDSEEDDDEDEGGKPAGKRNEHFRFFDGTAEANVKVQIQRLSAQQPKSPKPDQAIDWDSADLEDFDDLSTTDEEMGEISQVLRHRVRESGAQYLVTAEGQEVGEARWVLKANLQSDSAVEEIRIFEEIQAFDIQETSEDSDNESGSDEALDDLVEDIESEDDENARILAHASRMTDEQIARALAKQEELGMGGDELLLFDGDVGNGDDDIVVDEFTAGDEFIPFSTKSHLSSRGKSKRNRRLRDSFPPAEAFADALEQDPYGAFDIMDFDRPSLKPKKRGRKSDPLNWGLDDEELAEHLHSTWSKDREKKAARKQDKQEAREAAMLDSSERSHPAAIKAEIRQFLVQELEVLRLAPMESVLRASVHRLAKALKLKSHSEGKEGKGIGRFPVLTKGPHTPHYTVDTVWEIDALMNTKKFFPKQAGGAYRGANAPRTQGAVRARKGGGGTMSGATYMNGEVVGASAPELGSNNKGRLLLEKMGWTSGMGIGAVGNKGGLEAIKHVVKTTRAGLG